MDLAVRIVNRNPEGDDAGFGLAGPDAAKLGILQVKLEWSMTVVSFRVGVSVLAHPDGRPSWSCQGRGGLFFDE